MNHIKPKLPDPIFRKPKKWMPRIKKLKLVIPAKVIESWELILIEIKKWLERMGEKGMKIGIERIVDKFSIAIWGVVILFGIYIIVKIIGG